MTWSFLPWQTSISCIIPNNDLLGVNINSDFVDNTELFPNYLSQLNRLPLSIIQTQIIEALYGSTLTYIKNV